MITGTMNEAEILATARRSRRESAPTASAWDLLGHESRERVQAIDKEKDELKARLKELEAERERILASAKK